eukprot:9816460-Ditylum_brightwellii.AAC.1
MAHENQQRNNDPKTIQGIGYAVPLVERQIHTEAVQHEVEERGVSLRGLQGCAKTHPVLTPKPRGESKEMINRTEGQTSQNQEQ